MGTGSSRPAGPGTGTELPVELVALEVAASAAQVAADGAESWDAPMRRRALGLLEKVAGSLVVTRGKVVTAERGDGTWALRGDRDLAGFVGRETHQGRGAGRAVVGQAATLDAMPVVAGALVDGPVTVTHVAEITRATAASPKLAAQLATSEGQARLVELAGRLDGSRFGTALKQMSAALDPASRQRSHDEQRAARYLTISHTSAGTLVKAQLDSVAGHRFGKAIDALSPRPAKDDHRDPAQRRADALDAMVGRTLSDRTTTPGAVAPVQAVVTIREETWAALRAVRQARGGSTADVLDRLRGVPAVLDETGAAWPAVEIARALCDCVLTRAVLDARGQVLDLGLGERHFQRSHWLALLASGQLTCAVAGCSMPLRYTELHHMAWWDRDRGPTNLANCAPECAFHHAEIHRNDIRVTRRPDGVYEHRWPDGRVYGGAPPEAQDDPPGDRLESRRESRQEGLFGPLPERGPGDGEHRVTRARVGAGP